MLGEYRKLIGCAFATKSLETITSYSVHSGYRYRRDFESYFRFYRINLSLKACQQALQLYSSFQKCGEVAQPLDFSSLHERTNHQLQGLDTQNNDIKALFTMCVELSFFS
jgi:hypothetical protein